MTYTGPFDLEWLRTGLQKRDIEVSAGYSPAVAVLVALDHYRGALETSWFLVSDQMPLDGEIVYLWVEGPGKDADDEHFEVVAWPCDRGTRWAKAYGGGELKAKPLMWRRRPDYGQTEAILAALQHTEAGG